MGRSENPTPSADMMRIARGGINVTVFCELYVSVYVCKLLTIQLTFFDTYVACIFVVSFLSLPFSGKLRLLQ